MAERFTEQTVYTTADGKEFADKHLAELHADELELKNREDELLDYVEEHAIKTWEEGWSGLEGYLGVNGDKGILITIDDTVIDWYKLGSYPGNQKDMSNDKGKLAIFVYSADLGGSIFYVETLENVLRNMQSDMKHLQDLQEEETRKHNKRYTFHYAVHYGTEITVDANSEEEALDKANARAGEIYTEDMAFADGDLDLIDVEEVSNESSI